MNREQGYKYRYSRVLILLFFSICLILFVMRMYNFSVSLVGFLVILCFFIIMWPLILVKDIFHPFVLFAIPMLLAVIDFFNKDLINKGNSYLSLYSLGIILCWYLFLYLGYILSSKVKKDNTLTNKIFPPLRNSGKIAFTIGVISVIGFLFTYKKIGGISGMLNAMTITTVAYSGLGYLRMIVGLGGLAAILLLYKGFIKTAVVFLIVISIFLTLFGGRANVILGTILPFLMVYQYTVKTIKPWKLASIGGIGLLFVEIIGVLRKVSQDSFSFEGIWSMVSNAASATGRATTVPWLVGSLLNGDVEYQFGKPLLNILYAPIPRAIWNNKPKIIDGTVLVAYELTGSTSFGMPAGPYGEAFFNFGWIGVVLMGFITGCIIRRLYVNLALEIRKDTNEDFMGVFFYTLIIQSAFSIFTTSAQSKILWFVGIFVIMYFMDSFFRSIYKNS